MDSHTMPFDLSTAGGVQAYLAAAHPRLVPCSVRRLSGGYVNYVWSIHYDDGVSNGPGQLILKHYPPQAHGFPATMPQSRAQAEFNALVHTYALAQSTSTRSWSVPEPIHFDLTNHVVLMSKIQGAVPLLDLLRTPQPHADLICIGAALADFHQGFTAAFSKAAQRAWFVNDDMAKFHVPMRDFARWADLHSLPNAQVWLDRALGPNGFAHPNQTLIYGDFWPNSVLVHVPVASGKPVISVIDWEDHRLGHPGEDVAQMVGNLFIMLHGEGFDGDSVKVVLDAFVKGVRATSLDLDDGFDAEAVCIKSVTSLIRFPHWGVKDVKVVVKQAAEGGVKKVLGLE